MGGGGVRDTELAQEQFPYVKGKRNSSQTGTFLFCMISTYLQLLVTGEVERMRGPSTHRHDLDSLQEHGNLNDSIPYRYCFFSKGLSAQDLGIDLRY
jgi:ABC-type dipeptide/oligopeptide/nickel transport system permease component